MAEKEIRYLELIKGRFPQLETSKINYRFNQEKYSDLVVVNDETVFKFSKYDWTLFYLENEINIIPFIRQYVSLPLPNLEQFDREAVKYNFLEGGPLIREKVLLLDNYEQDHIAEQIGVFLNQLHSIPIKAVRNNGIVDNPTSLTREGWLSEYEEIRRKVYPYCEPHTTEVIDLIFSQLLNNENFLKYQPALIHADLTSGHYIFDEKSKTIREINGFSLSGIGDPAYDTASIISHLGEGFMKRVGRYYRGIDSAFINRARFYALTNRLLWAKGVADMIATRDLSRLRLSLDERDIMPIGTRWY